MQTQRRRKASHPKRWVVGGASLLVVAAGVVGIWQMDLGEDPDLAAGTPPTVEVGGDSTPADDTQPVGLSGRPAGAGGVSTVPIGPGAEPSDEEIRTMLSLDETATDELSDADVAALVAAVEDGVPLSDDVAQAEAELDEAIDASETSASDPGDPAEWDAGIESDPAAESLDDLDEDADQFNDRLQTLLPDAPEGDDR
ncbi:hypothetical protein NF556_19715 [Ornithinimicrobium faecis]|uniref:Uncharacterized protein n=1 Tax=Ornithinimicrobium faecis TaxID=2934158 RepID=A0ABY4YSQ8_9MICO|nr:hypothetical protein [Ornithinimicrobium sp. HY1793]USQ79786.1 hypothetical protein NF556_19715 [Ornithinimicrobium sp. HY1793]